VIPSAIWDWTAALVGLRSGEGLYLPAYWCLPSRLTAASGWVPTPNAVLWLLTFVALLGVVGYVCKRRSGFLYLSCAVWGALMADTPYVVFLPLVLLAAWYVALRMAKLFKTKLKSLHSIYWKRLFTIYLVSFLTAFVCNLLRCGVAYIPAYAKNALAALRWDGGWHPIDVSKMDKILDAYVKELAREAEGKRWIFTDGLCDSGIELAAASACRKGTPQLRTVSFAKGSYDEEEGRFLGFSRQEDLAALERGAPGLLRSWAKDRPSELTNAVFQGGFSFLEREAVSNKLEMCGLVLRLGSSDSDAAASRVNELAEKILEFYQDGGNPANGGRIRQTRFCAMQWRVARAVRRQATALDRRKKVREALSETALSEELDRRNPFARKQDAEAEAISLRAFGTLTPREGLDLSLSRANFALARRFAQPILKDDPRNVEANFAMAMSHLVRQEHAQALHYLEIALKELPHDAALLNNAAACSLALGNVREAEKMAREALKQMPDSAAIKDTLSKIEQAKKRGG